MNIGFWDNALNERGTSASMFDYAYYNQLLLNNKSFIFYDKNNWQNNNEIINKFKNHFIVHETDNFKEVDSYIEQYNISHLYIQKYGLIDDRISKIAKNCIHAVFDCSQPHGEIYSPISDFVRGNERNYPSVPYIVQLPKHNLNLRKKLKIPNNAIVFGGYGGQYNFSIEFVKEVVYEIAISNPNIYFLFANFNKFCNDLPNIIHLPIITDPIDKVKFINTCDAMLWARSDGETFGLAIAEFSINNKPVIAMDIGDKAHVHLLKDKAIWYDNKDNLKNILLNFNPKIEKKKDWNAYRDFTPEKVMNIFKNIFLINN